MASQVLVRAHLAGVGRGVNDLSVDGPCDGGNGSGMSAEPGNLFAGGDVPDRERMIGAAADDFRSVGVKSHGENLGAVAFERGNLLLCSNLPDLDQPIASGADQL